MKNASKTLYISGQVGIDSLTNQMVEGGTEAEFKQIMKNISNILQEVDGTLE